jgi:short subunit dehydrogenase-like uncharacterized protein
MATNDFLLYGANGYTGRLIARLSKEYGLRPLLAGRNKASLQKMAGELGLEFRITTLENMHDLQEVLSTVPAVLNTAGPFQFTAKPMIEACLATGKHYLDITGEISVFEMARLYNRQAEKAGIILLPGTGFDVVPTDCMARYLKDRMPDAISLKLAFTTLGGALSRGTALTMIESLGQSGASRKNSRIVREPVGKNAMWVDYGSMQKFVMSIPWGDIATAYHTTGIPDIETYTGVSPLVYRLMKFQNMFNWLLRTRFFRSLAKKKINKGPAGPSEKDRLQAKSLVWGQVENASGQSIQAHFSGPEGYTFTSHSSLVLMKKILTQKPEAGFKTPAGLFGAGLLQEVPGVSNISYKPSDQNR